jgi:hypothetical protein
MPRSTSRAFVIACALLLSAAPDVPDVAAQKAGVYLRTATEVRLRSAADIEQIEVRVADIRSSRAEVRAVTDLMLRLTADGAAIDTALLAANAPAGARLKPSFRVAVYTVIGGRITRDTDATCDQWREDAATCRLDCDGGAFILRRRGRGALSLVIGRAAGQSGEAARPGFALNACATGDAGELILAPRGGREAAELALTGD